MGKWAVVAVAAALVAVGIIVLLKTQQVENRSAQEHYFEGEKYLEAWDLGENVERAITAFSEALERDRNFAEAHAGLALALWRRYTESHDPLVVNRAEREAQLAIELGPLLPETQLALGVVELGRGHPARAATAFKKAQRLAPADDAVCRRIADVYAKLGKYREAESFYQRAVDLRPSYWGNMNSLGLLYLRIGDLDQAKLMFRRVIEIRPKGDVGYMNLSATHILAGEFNEAEPFLEAALRIKPTSEGYNNLGFIYYASGRFQEASRQWSRAADLAPDDPVPFANLGDALRQLHRTEEATRAYGRAIHLFQRKLRVNPADAESQVGLAVSLAGVGRCDDAETAAANGTTREPNNPTYHYYAAVAHMVCGDRESAITHTLRAIQGGAVVDVRSNPDLKPLLEYPSVRELLSDL